MEENKEYPLPDEEQTAPPELPEEVPLIVELTMQSLPEEPASEQESVLPEPDSPAEEPVSSEEPASEEEPVLPEVPAPVEETVPEEESAPAEETPVLPETPSPSDETVLPEEPSPA